MPEGCECEKLRRQLDAAWPGRMFTRITPVWDTVKCDKFFAPLYRTVFESRIQGKTVLDVDRRGKWLIVNSVIEPIFAFHLGGTGWFLPNFDLSEAFPHENFIHRVNEKALRFRMVLGAQAIGNYVPYDQEWEYYDGRTWGQFIIPVPGKEPWRGYGPDWITNPSWAASALMGYECRGAKTVKQVLCEPRVTAGIGNYLACEICFRAGVRPNKTWASLSDHRVLMLARKTKECVDSSMAHNDHSWWAVFKREGEPCKVCGRTISYEKDPGGSRGSYFCSSCQVA